MIEEKSKKEIFRHENNYRRMDKIYKYVYGDLTSFEDMKKHSGKRFKEITKRLREEGKKLRKKNNERKCVQGMMDEESHLNHHPQ